ncbi:hypothetical protein [Gimesia aquarii]|uniref:Uncharacterized protein n=1 Tax=Gimesia aquarii TaxID=2527964 RepID=A0A517WQ38_9PLAN|nr:hypothetical protein [Gimesia aquarii]QDU07382.1 hypothetical protein V202x_07350 [Gimesia aquarii]
MSGSQSGIVCFLLLTISLMITGCGGDIDDAPEVAPVSGTVQFNGKPLEEGTIVFHPTSGRSASGMIKGGKIIDVTTTTKGDGAPVGDNKVTIFSTKPDPKDLSGMGTISLIPEKYNDVKKSGLNAMIKGNQENTVTFDLKK